MHDTPIRKNRQRHNTIRGDDRIAKLNERKKPVLDNMKREGRNEGIEIGRKEGREEGLKEGLKEGSLRVLREIANNNGNRKTAEELAQKFGYTLEEVLNSK